MLYQYRWVYALGVGFFIILLAYSLDLQALLNQHATLSKKEKHLINRLQSFQPILPKSTRFLNYTLNDRELLSDLTVHAHFNNVTLLAAKYIKPKTVELILQGSFDRLAFFVEALSRSSRAMLLGFSCHQLSIGRMNMHMEVVAIPHGISLSGNHVKCSSTTQMKMSGFLQQGRRQVAFITLPTQRVIAVMVGSKLNEEQGIVQAIYRDRIIVERHNQQLIIRRA